MSPATERGHAVPPPDLTRYKVREIERLLLPIRFKRPCEPQLAIFRVLKPLTPLSEIPEHTKVRLTVEALPMTGLHGSVIDEQRQHRIALDATVARDLGDRHEYDLFES
jgi:hypothetical protein